jgi:hypothetical protein
MSKSYFIITLFLILSSALKAETSFRFIKFKKNPDQPTMDLHKALMKTVYSQTNPLYLEKVSKSGNLEKLGIFQVMRDYLSPQFEQIAQFEIDRLVQFNRQYNLGETNFSGFNWQKPMGTFDLDINRQVTPDPIEIGRWLVTDTFVISINAITYLNKLNENQLLEMSEEDIQAFAGITFERKYETHHYEANYIDGLKSSFTSLFLPFLNFGPQSLWALKEEMLKKRSDKWTLKANGQLRIPLNYGFNISGGLNLLKSHESTITLMDLGQEKPLSLNIESKNETNLGLQGQLQHEFISLLNLTLFSGSLEFNSLRTQSVSLKFNPGDEAKVINNPVYNQEWHQLFRSFSPKISALEPFVTVLNENLAQGSKQTFQFLLFGSLKKSNIEQVRIIKDQTVSIFFKSYSESIQSLKNIKDLLLSSKLLSFFKFNKTESIPTSVSKKVMIEYEATLPQSFHPKLMSIDDSEKFSMEISYHFESGHENTKNLRPRIQKAMAAFMDRFTTLADEEKSNLKISDLNKKINIDTYLRFNHLALDYFSSLSQDKKVDLFLDLCQVKNKLLWKKNLSGELKKPHLGPGLCMKQVWRSQSDFFSSLSQNKRYDLFQFKKIVQKIVKKARTLNTLKLFFGDQIYLMGQAEGKSSQGFPLTYYFQGGQFLGFGIIEDFKRKL